MSKTYKVISSLKHDAVLYTPGQLIQDVEGLEHLVEAGVLAIVEDSTETNTQSGTPTDTQEEKTVAPVSEETKPAGETPAAPKTQSIPVVGSGDVDPDETKKKDPDTGANL